MSVRPDDGSPCTSFKSVKSDPGTEMFSTKALQSWDWAAFAASFKGRAVQQFSAELGIAPDVAMEAVAVAGAAVSGMATVFPR